MGFVYLHLVDVYYGNPQLTNGPILKNDPKHSMYGIATQFHPYNPMGLVYLPSLKLTART